MHYKFTGPVRFWYPKQPVNSPCGDRKLRTREGQCDARTWVFFLQFWLYQFPYVSVRVSHGALIPTRAPYVSCKIWKMLKISLRGPRDARWGIARGTRGVLRIIQPNHKCTAVSSRTGAVAWCDHENSTNVKIPMGASLGLTGKKSYGW